MIVLQWIEGKLLLKDHHNNHKEFKPIHTILLQEWFHNQISQTEDQTLSKWEHITNLLLGSLEVPFMVR